MSKSKPGSHMMKQAVPDIGLDVHSQSIGTAVAQGSDGTITTPCGATPNAGMPRAAASFLPIESEAVRRTEIEGHRPMAALRRAATPLTLG